MTKNEIYTNFRDENDILANNFFFLNTFIFDHL